MAILKSNFCKYLSLAMIFSVITASFAYGAGINEIVVFGDSLSDNGNLLLIEGQPIPDETLYYEGRFSNGLVWPEYLTDATRLNVALDDNALGGAETAGSTIPGVVEQITAYLVGETNSLSEDALFIIWAGGNDCLNGDRDYEASISNLNNAMSLLAQAGARHILLLNLPDLGAIPDTQDSDEYIYASEFSLNFNQALANLIDTFSTEHPQIGVYEYDIYALFEKILSDPTSYGFTNVSEPSPNFDVANNFDAEGYLFWDDVHPTTQMHAIIADKLAVEINEQIPDSDGDTSEDSSGDSASGSCFIDTLFTQ